jgi:hypothetical protein
MPSPHVHVDEQSLVVIMGEGVRLDEEGLGRRRETDGNDEGERSMAKRVLDMMQKIEDPAHFLSELVGSWSLFLYHKGECMAARGSDGVQDLFFSISAAEKGGQMITFSNSPDHFQEGDVQSLKPGHYCTSSPRRRISTHQFALSPDELDARMRKEESVDFSESSGDDDLQLAGTSSTRSRQSGSGPLSGILRNLSIKIKRWELSLSPGK